MINTLGSMVRKGCLLALLCPSLLYAKGLIHLDVDDAKRLKYKTPIETVFVANPAIADFQVLKGNQLVIFGKTVGATGILIQDAEGTTIDNKTIVVNQSLIHIRSVLQQRYPDQNIVLTNLGEEVLLTGTVPNEEMKADIHRLVGELLGKDSTKEELSMESGGEDQKLRFMTQWTYKGIVNQIEVEEVKQVNVKITVAEVSHTFLRQLGFNWQAFGDGMFLNDQNGLNLSDFLSDISSSDFARYLIAMDDDNMGQVLAEPNLSVISGETASFLVGGEVPIITHLEDRIQITYKEFGIRLDLAANVLKDDKIKLFLQPEVSAVDPTVFPNSLDIPGFKTRKTKTTVQLGNGESFILGGLLTTEERESLAKIPLIGDVPVLGALFRRTRKQTQKSELLIIATVNLVRPVQRDSIQIPQIQFNHSLQRFFKVHDLGNPQTGKAQAVLSKGGFKE